MPLILRQPSYIIKNSVERTKIMDGTAQARAINPQDAVRAMRKRLGSPEPLFENPMATLPRFISVSDTMAMRLFVRAYIREINTCGFNASPDSMNFQPHPELRLITTFEVLRTRKGHERQSSEMGFLSIYTDKPEGLGAGTWVMRIDTESTARQAMLKSVRAALEAPLVRGTFRLPVLISDGEFHIDAFSPSLYKGDLGAPILYIPSSHSL